MFAVGKTIASRIYGFIAVIGPGWDRPAARDDGGRLRCGGYGRPGWAVLAHLDTVALYTQDASCSYLARKFQSLLTKLTSSRKESKESDVPKEPEWQRASAALCPKPAHGENEAKSHHAVTMVGPGY